MGLNGTWICDWNFQTPIVRRKEETEAKMIKPGSLTVSSDDGVESKSKGNDAAHRK